MGELFGVLGEKLLLLDHGDAALAVGIGIIFAYHAAQYIHDVIDEHLVVDHDGILQQGAALEHGHAVTGGFEHVVVAGQGVGLGQIQRLIAYLDILYAVFAGNTGEHAIGVHLYGGLHIQVDLIAHARDLQEAAAFAGSIAGAHLQGIKDLLAGGFHHAHFVAEGMHRDDLTVGDIARGNADTDAAAIDHGDIGTGHGPVSIGAQVAQVGFLPANHTLAADGIIDGQLDLGGGYDGIDDLLVAGFDLGDGIAHAVIVDEGGGELAVGGNGQAADIGELGAGGGEDDILAFLILNNIPGDGGVGVAIQHHINAAGVHNDIRGGPGLAVRLDAQVRHGDDILGTFLAGGVHSALYGGIQLLAGIILHKAVDIVAVPILEVGGGGGGDGLGGGNADKGDLYAVGFLDDIGLQHGVAVLVYKVAADVVKVGLFNQLIELVHAVVELMVAGGGYIVAQLVHDVDDVLALGKGANGVTLNGVAVIYQQDFIACGQQRTLGGGKALVAHAILDAAVGVIGVQDHDVFGRGGRITGTAACQYHDEYQHQCQNTEFSHSVAPP